jgi:hypothetical protein
MPDTRRIDHDFVAPEPRRTVPVMSTGPRERRKPSVARTRSCLHPCLGNQGRDRAPVPGPDEEPIPTARFVSAGHVPFSGPARHPLAPSKKRGRAHTLWTALIAPRNGQFQSVCFQADHSAPLLLWSGHGPVLLRSLHQGRDRASAAPTPGQSRREHCYLGTGINDV